MAKDKFKISENPLINSPLFAQGEETTEEKKTAGRHRNESLVRDNSVQNGLTEDFTRATFIISVETLEKLKNYAYTERISLKEAITKAVDSYIDQYVANGGKLLDRNKR